MNKLGTQVYAHIFVIHQLINDVSVAAPCEEDGAPMEMYNKTLPFLSLFPWLHTDMCTVSSMWLGCVVQEANMDTVAQTQHS